MDECGSAWLAELASRVGQVWPHAERTEGAGKNLENDRAFENVNLSKILKGRLEIGYRSQARTANAFWSCDKFCDMLIHG